MKKEKPFLKSYKKPTFKADVFFVHEEMLKLLCYSELNEDDRFIIMGSLLSYMIYPENIDKIFDELKKLTKIYLEKK